MNQKFRILSLSGGGIRGLYTASFLARIEELTSKRFIDHFDLIVGTSTGGLIALTIGLNQQLVSIRDFYKDNGSILFPCGRIQRTWLFYKQTVYPKHKDSILRELIQKRIGNETLLSHSKRPLVINAYHAAGGKPVCFKTRHHSAFEIDHKKKAWEIAMATSAAPVFYRAFQAEDGTDYIDGGIWANCPVLVGAIEAIHRFNRTRDQIEILSVGTTRSPFHLPHGARSGGAWKNISMKNRAVVNMMMEANRAASMYMAKHLIGSDSIFEVDHIVDGGGYEMDDSRKEVLRDLMALGEDDAKTHIHEVRSRFFSEPAPPWEPIA